MCVSVYVLTSMGLYMCLYNLLGCCSEYQQTYAVNNDNTDNAKQLRISARRYVLYNND